MPNKVLQTKLLVGIVDDNNEYRAALCSYLNERHDIKVVLEAKDGAGLANKIKKAIPDIILLDIEMPKVGGIDVLKKIRHLYPSIKFIALTLHKEKELIRHIIELGGNSYLNKASAPNEIYNAIINCYKNDYYLNSSISEALIREEKQPKRPAK